MNITIKRLALVLAMCFALCLFASCRDEETDGSSAPEQSVGSEEEPSAVSEPSEEEDEPSAVSEPSEAGTRYLLPTKIVVYVSRSANAEFRLFYNGDTCTVIFDAERANGVSHVTWEYDEAGRLAATVKYRSDGSEFSRTVNEYDAEGREVKRSTFYDGYQDEFERFTYDAEGNLSRVVMNYQDGKVGRISEYDADGRRVLITQNNHPDGRLLCRVEILYDEHGTVVERSETDAKGNLYFRQETVCEYDGDGNLVKEIVSAQTTEDDGTVQGRRIEYRYENDTNGLPVKCYIYDRNIPLGGYEAQEYASFPLTEEQYLRYREMLAQIFLSVSNRQAF